MRTEAARYDPERDGINHGIGMYAEVALIRWPLIAFSGLDADVAESIEGEFASHGCGVFSNRKNLRIDIDLYRF